MPKSCELCGSGFMLTHNNLGRGCTLCITCREMAAAWIQRQAAKYAAPPPVIIKEGVERLLDAEGLGSQDKRRRS